MRYCLFIFTILNLSMACNAAQFCQINSINASTPNSQFTHNLNSNNALNGTVTDIRTGLMWKQCVEGQNGVVEQNKYVCRESGDSESFTWQAALLSPQTLNVTGGFAGHNDWRLPNIKELASIIENQCESPALNLELFPSTNNSLGFFWSSTPFTYPSSLEDETWYIFFGSATPLHLEHQAPENNIDHSTLHRHRGLETFDSRLDHGKRSTEMQVRLVRGG